MTDFQNFIKIATEWGIFAALFILLLIYVMRENRTREMDYRTIIKLLGDKLLEISKDSNTVIHGMEDKVVTMHERIECVGRKIDVMDDNIDSIGAKTGTVIGKLDIINNKLELMNHDINSKNK
jgi:hypothetical protein